MMRFCYCVLALGLASVSVVEACDPRAVQRPPNEDPVPGAWVKWPGNPVFVKNTPGHWDSDWITCFSVRKIGATYWMYYAARRDSSRPMSIGVATSPDGINWTRYPDSVVAPGPAGRWDDNCVYGPDVVFHHGEYLMLYVGQRIGGGCGIGLATSVDGYHWQKPLSTPVIASGACLSTDVEGDSVIMLYMANNGFRRASSFDGVTWSIHAGGPVFLPGDTTQWDELIASPSLVIFNGQYHLWYTGADTLGNARGKIQIGWATSTDRGRTWTRFSGNPVLIPTQPWEGKCLYSNNAVMTPTLYQMWYASAGFGYAYNDITSVDQPIRYERPTSIVQFYPNPARSRLNMVLNVVRKGEASIEIFDSNGRGQQTINTRFPKPGENLIDIPINPALPAGVYFAVIRVGNTRLVKSFILVR